MMIRFTAHAFERMVEHQVSIAMVDFGVSEFHFSATAGTSTWLEVIIQDKGVLRICIEGGLPLSEIVIVRTVAWKGE